MVCENWHGFICIPHVALLLTSCASSEDVQGTKETLTTLNTLNTIEQQNLTVDQRIALDEVRGWIISNVMPSVEPQSEATIEIRTTLVERTKHQIPINDPSPSALSVFFVPAGIYIVINGPANLRIEPSLQATRLSLLPEGTKIKGIDKSGDWFFVSIGDRQGWIHGTLLALSNIGDEALASRVGSPAPSAAPETGDPVEQFAKQFGGGPYSFRCLEEREQCRLYHNYYDCSITYVYCMGEAFIRAVRGS